MAHGARCGAMGIEFIMSLSASPQGMPQPSEAYGDGEGGRGGEGGGLKDVGWEGKAGGLPDSRRHFM